MLHFLRKVVIGFQAWLRPLQVTWPITTFLSISSKKGNTITLTKPLFLFVYEWPQKHTGTYYCKNETIENFCRGIRLTPLLHFLFFYWQPGSSIRPPSSTTSISFFAGTAPRRARPCASIALLGEILSEESFLFHEIFMKDKNLPRVRIHRHAHPLSYCHRGFHVILGLRCHLTDILCKFLCSIN